MEQADEAQECPWRPDMMICLHISNHCNQPLTKEGYMNRAHDSELLHRHSSFARGRMRRGGEDCQILRNDQRSLVRQETTQAWVWTRFIRTYRSTTLVWAPCGWTSFATHAVLLPACYDSMNRSVSVLVHTCIGPYNDSLRPKSHPTPLPESHSVIIEMAPDMLHKRFLAPAAGEVMFADGAQSPLHGRRPEHRFALLDHLNVAFPCPLPTIGRRPRTSRPLPSSACMLRRSTTACCFSRECTVHGAWLRLPRLRCAFAGRTRDSPYFSTGSYKSPAQHPSFFNWHAQVFDLASSCWVVYCWLEASIDQHSLLDIESLRRFIRQRARGLLGEVRHLLQELLLCVQLPEQVVQMGDNAHNFLQQKL